MGKQKKVKRKGSRGYRIVYGLLAGIVGFLFGYKVINQERERDEGGYIVCGNHVSATDAIALCYAFRKNQVCFMGKKELWEVAILRPILDGLGGFPVDRGASDTSALRTAVNILKEGDILGIFPEGTRSKGPVCGPFMKGSIKLATKPGVPIVPVSMNGTYKMFEETGIISPTLIRIIVHEPIPTKGISRQEEKELNDRVEKIVVEGVQKLAKEMGDL